MWYESCYMNGCYAMVSFDAPRIHQPSCLVAFARSKMEASSSPAVLVLYWNDLSSKMMYLLSSESSRLSKCEDNFFFDLTVPCPAWYEPKVDRPIVLLLFFADGPLIPLGAPVGLPVEPKAEDPKIFLISGRRIGIHAPMMTQFASMLVEIVG